MLQACLQSIDLKVDRHFGERQHNPTLQSNANGVGAPTSTQLLEYMTDVDLHGALGNFQRRADFFVRLASHHQSSDVDFSVRKVRAAQPCSAVFQSSLELASNSLSNTRFVPYRTVYLLSVSLGVVSI
jgi:hypothetical protein